MPENSDTISLTADVVSAFVSNNSVTAADLPGLIQQVFRALSETANGPAAEEAAPLTPPVPIKKSVAPDYLISLEDGRKYKSLKRHLATRGMTPDAYRAKWGLPRDYPMVAANYSAQRSQLAKALGLGQGGRAAAAAATSAEPEAVDVAPQVAAESVESAPAPARRGRRKAA